jgi:hypothetical protein
MQEEVDGAAVPRGGDREPTERDGEDKDEDGTKREVGERETEERDHPEGAVLPAIAMKRGGDTCGNGSCNAYDESSEREGEGIGIALQDEMSNRVMQAE